jgi:hypothetical protein
MRLSAKTLPSIAGGAVGEMIDQAMARCLADCDDRAGLKKNRSVSIKVELGPQTDEQGNLIHVNLGVEVGCSIPNQSLDVQKIDMKQGRDGLRGEFVTTEGEPDEVEENLGKAS